MIINDLEDSQSQKHDSQKIQSKIINDLIEYTQYHFSFEEKIMEKYGYPHLDNHHLEHKSFMKDVDVFCSKWKKGGPDIINALIHYLKNWLINHILTSDKKYADYFQEKNITIHQDESDVKTSCF